MVQDRRLSDGKKELGLWMPNSFPLGQPMQDRQHIKINWCPICDQGWIQILKEKQSGTLFLCCDECETEWLSPSEIQRENGSQGRFGESASASQQEAETMGWDKFAVNS